jgi:hypothetical protein
MYEIKVVFSIEQKGRLWKATAASGSALGYGDGTSRDVAVSRAADRLIKAMDEDDNSGPPQQEVSGFKPTHLVMAGRREGEKVQVTGIAFESLAGKKFAVLYEDGTTGIEREQYLKQLP